jgi:ribonuclease HII
MPPSLDIENSLNGVVCGIDEAGRGPWCGPVVAAAVIMGQGAPTGINDSKKLSEKKRESLYEQIIKTCQYGVGVASVEEIDSLNILNATKLAMLRAFEALPQKPDYALIDGNQLPNLPCKMQYVIKGDSVSLSIAAASIVAKVTRDRFLAQIAAEFPQYDWLSNKGYGTASHSQAIEKYGITAHHRKSYAPIKKYLAS